MEARQTYFQTPVNLTKISFGMYSKKSPLQGKKKKTVSFGGLWGMDGNTYYKE